MPAIADLQEARARLAGVINPTPLQLSRTLSSMTGATVWLKPECLQRTGSFKIRGAFNKVASLTPEERGRGVITYSSGNHAQGMACAARLLGAKAVVVMPEDAVPAKVEATRGYGAEVEFRGVDSFQRQRRAQELQAEHGYTMVPPFDDSAIVAGQGSVGLEIVSELPDVDVVLVPVGGGGLLAGVSLGVKLSLPSATVIGVEPEGANDAQQSLARGEVVTIDDVRTIADGLRPKRLGSLNFEVIRRFVDRIVTVSDGEIRDAMRFLLMRAKLVVEPSGAVGVAALLAGKLECAGKRVAVVLSGGNADPSTLVDVLSEKVAGHRAV